VTADQLALFVEAGSNGNGRPAKGPEGLLMALVEMSLDEDALEIAAALVIQMDSEPLGEDE
jgi:hypothetical protein